MDSTQLGSLPYWSEARLRLDNALLHFHKATNALGATLSNALDPGILEKTAVEFDLFSSSMATRIENLKATDITLKKIRNQSTSLVPINKLPVETLLRVLRFSVQGEHGSSDDSSSPPGHKPLFVLTRVCTHWRSIIISTPSFWSYIRLNYRSGTNLTTLCNRLQQCLERACNQPLVVELNFNLADTISRCEVKNIATHLRGYLKNVTTLGLKEFQYSDVVLELFSFWLTHGQPSSVRGLALWGHGSSRDSMRIYSTNAALTQQHIDSLLQPIRKLSLSGVYFDWHSPVYHNLVTLQLLDLTGGSSPTLQQIIGILSSCPELKHLQFYNLHISTGESTPLQQVVLNKLVYLDLKGVNPEGLSSLLPMIHSSSQALSAKIDLYRRESNAGSAIQSFLSRVNITRLYISRLDGFRLASTEVVAEYLAAVPNLNALILDLNSQPGDATLAATMRSSESTTEPICPRLHTLYLIDGSLQNDTVKNVVQTHPFLKKLRFISCLLDPFDEELLYWLKPFVKDVECRTRLGTTKARWHQSMT